MQRPSPMTVSVTPWIRLQRLVAAVCLVLLTLGTAPAATLAQRGNDGDISDEMQDAGVIDDGEWESPQFGVGATWGGDFVVLEDATYSDPDAFLDTLSLGTDTVYFGVTIVQSVDETPAEYMQRLIDLRSGRNGVEDFEIIDQDEDGDLAWLVYTGVDQDSGDTFVNGTEVDYYDEDEGIMRLVNMSAWPDEAADAFAAVQDDIEVDGDAPFLVLTADDLAVDVPEEDVTPEDVTPEDEETPADEDVTPEDEDVTPEDEETPENEDVTPEDEEVTPADEETPADEDVTPEDEETPADEDVTPEDEETPAAEDVTPESGGKSDDELEALGLVSRRGYESPQFGAEVDWPRGWTVNEASLTSDTQNKQDNLQLTDENGAVFQATFFVNAEETPAEYIDRLVEFRAGLDSIEDLAVVDQGEVEDRAYVIYTATVSGDQVLVLAEVGVYDTNVMVKVEMMAPVDDAQDVFDTIQDDFDLDGEAPFLFDDDLPAPDEV